MSNAMNTTNMFTQSMSAFGKSLLDGNFNAMAFTSGLGSGISALA
jgi:uncharacterized membrane protein YqgA involved in biofilm formation